MYKLTKRFLSMSIFKPKYMILSLSFLISFPLVNRSTQAITMKAYSLLKLQTDANLMVHGYIKAISYQRLQGRLVTVYHWKASKVYKNDLQINSDSIYMTLPGGIERNLEQLIPGVPKLNKDTEYFAFLKCEKRDHIVCSPIGYGQGLWKPYELHKLHSQEGNEAQLNSNASLWHSLIEHINWSGPPPQHQKLSIKQLLGNLSPKDESQLHLLPNVTQP